MTHSPRTHQEKQQTTAVHERIDKNRAPSLEPRNLQEPGTRKALPSNKLGTAGKQQNVLDDDGPCGIRASCFVWSITNCIRAGIIAREASEKVCLSGVNLRAPRRATTMNCGDISAA